MAKGRFVRRFEAFLALLGVIGVVIVYSLLTGWQLLPSVGNWFTRLSSQLTSLSDPAPTWQTSVGDQPVAATATDFAVVVISRGGVEAHRTSTGDKLWYRAGDWAAVGGTGNDVVIVGRTGRHHGYDAIDPDTGSVRWTNDSAIGVWTFTNLIVDLTCPQATSCQLTARSPETGSKRWTSTLTGNARSLAGANKALSGLRPFDGDGDPQPAAPAPPLLGFPVDGQLEVVASASGRRLHTYEPTQTTRIVVAGNRVVVSNVVSRDGGCQFSVEGRDPDGDRRVWHLDGYDLKTTAGVACEQHSDPLGGDGLLDAVAPDGHQLLINVSNGSRAYQVAAGETVIATDGQTMLVRAADGQTVRAVRVSGGSTVWTHKTGKSVQVDFGPGVVLFTDSGANRLVALSTQGGTLVDVGSGATLLGYAQDGLVIHIGLRVGLLSYHGSAG
jgi:hypothetical protein